MIQATAPKSRLLERVRWRAAWMLCRLPFTCNTNLICWAAWADREQVTQGRWRQGRMCHQDAERNGSCYCGKIGRDRP